jgi:hypothetical protein
MTDPWCWYINANIKGVYSWDPWHTIYSSTMDPSWDINCIDSFKVCPDIAIAWIFDFWLVLKQLGKSYHLMAEEKHVFDFF